MSAVFFVQNKQREREREREEREREREWEREERERERDSSVTDNLQKCWPKNWKVKQKQTSPNLDINTFKKKLIKSKQIKDPTIKTKQK